VDTQNNLVPFAAPAPTIAPLPARSVAAASRIANVKSAPLEQRGFSTADILWALGIWSVIICLSPVILFYMLMVA
jgi:hypothetical protein